MNTSKELLLESEKQVGTTFTVQKKKKSMFNHDWLTMDCQENKKGRQNDERHQNFHKSRKGASDVSRWPTTNHFFQTCLLAQDKQI